MDRRTEQILERQEAYERAAYRSADELRAMIAGDFAGVEALLAQMDARGIDVVELFARPDFPELARSVAVPVRTASELAVHKHTRMQVPYYHAHDFYELVYVLRGRSVQHVEGRAVPIALAAGTAALLAPGAVHLMERAGEKDLVLKISIPPAVFARVGDPVATALKAGGELAVFDASTAAADYHACQLVCEQDAHAEGWRQAAESHLALLLVDLARGQRSEPDELAVLLGAYLDEAGADASLAGFADRAGYSSAYAARLVSERCGRPFSELARAHRMRCARELLLASDAPVAAVARQLGYASASGLHKAFLAAYGMTPAAYRELFG